MLRIECPFCGLRDEPEFAYGGESQVTRPAGGAGDAGGKIGVLVELTGGDKDALAPLAREVALHIASANPKFLSEGEVDGSVVEKEREIARAQAANDPKMAGKPADMLEKIAAGKLNAFFKEQTLTAQAFVKDGSKTVEQYLKEAGDVKVLSFKRVAVG